MIFYNQMELCNQAGTENAADKKQNPTAILSSVPLGVRGSTFVFQVAYTEQN